MMSSVLTIIASAGIAYAIYEVIKKKGFDKSIMLTTSVLALLLVSAIVLSFKLNPKTSSGETISISETCIELEVIDSLQKIITEKENEITRLELTLKTIEETPKTPYYEPEAVRSEKSSTEIKVIPKTKVNEEELNEEYKELTEDTIPSKDKEKEVVENKFNDEIIKKKETPQIRLPFRNHIYDIEVYNCKENKELKSRNREFCFVFKSNHKDLLRESTLEFLANGVPLRIIKAQRIQQGTQDIHHAVYYIRAHNDEHLYQGKNQVMIRVKNVPFYLNFLLRR